MTDLRVGAHSRRMPRSISWQGQCRYILHRKIHSSDSTSQSKHKNTAYTGRRKHLPEKFHCRRSGVWIKINGIGQLFRVFCGNFSNTLLWVQYWDKKDCIRVCSMPFLQRSGAVWHQHKKCRWLYFPLTLRWQCLHR